MFQLVFGVGRYSSLNAHRADLWKQFLHTLLYICFFLFIVYPSVTHKIMKGPQAFGEVNHALMRKQCPYRPGASRGPTFVLPSPWWRPPPWLLHELTLNPCNPIP